MQYRKLGDTGIELSVIGFGAWAIGGEWEWGWGPQDDAESVTTIHRALEVGVNWIDTAAIYAHGHSEEVIGKAIAGHRDEWFIATKCTRLWTVDKTIISKGDPASIRQELEDSLRRLNVETIDLFQLHWPTPETPLEDTWGAMADFVNEGKVRYIGLSNFMPDLMDQCQAIHPVASLQPPYSMVRRDIETEILPYCRRNNIGVIPYSPMQSGLLTDNFDPDKLTTNDWRRKKDQAEFDRAAAIVKRLKPLAERAGKTMAQLAIAWVNAQPGITASIVGSRRPAQIEETARAGDWTLSDGELAQVAEVLDAVE